MTFNVNLRLGSSSSHFVVWGEKTADKNQTCAQSRTKDYTSIHQYTHARTHWNWKQPESMFKVEFYIIRLTANCLQVHWEHPIFKTFSKGFHPPTPLSSSNLVHPPLQSLYPLLFIGHQLCTLLYFFGFCCTFIGGIHNFIIDKGLSRYYQISWLLSQPLSW